MSGSQTSDHEGQKRPPVRLSALKLGPKQMQNMQKGDCASNAMRVEETG